jgi:hypothetical protein
MNRVIALLKRSLYLVAVVCGLAAGVASADAYNPYPDPSPWGASDEAGQSNTQTPAKVLQAKKLIKEFRRNLSRFLERGDQNEVYRLNIQLFPVTRVEDR